MTEQLTLSTLPKTWIFDVDGTLLVHNGYKTPEGDQLLPGVKDFFQKIPKEDKIILLTARTEDQRKALEIFLSKNNLRYDHIIYSMPVGERILINDRKPSGLETALAVNIKRDHGIRIDIKIDKNI